MASSAMSLAEPSFCEDIQNSYDLALPPRHHRRSTEWRSSTLPALWWSRHAWRIGDALLEFSAASSRRAQAFWLCAAFGTMLRSRAG